MTVFLVIISIALVAITLFAMHKTTARKAHNAETERINQERMAYLRERKEQKKAEREAAAEAERLRQEELARQHEKEEEKKNQAIKRLGLFEDTEGDDEDEDDTEGTWYSTAYTTDEYVDFDKLLKLVDKYSYDLEPIRIRICTSSGNTLTFWINDDEEFWAVRPESGKVKKLKSEKILKNYVKCFCQNERIKTKNAHIAEILKDGVNNAATISPKSSDTEKYLTDILLSSNYYGIILNQATVHCENDIALIEYELPSREDLSWVKEYKYVQADNTIKEVMLPETTIVKTYENLIYSICLRSIYELCVSKKTDEVQSIVFNGFVSAINKANGLKERKCILSLQVAKEKFLQVDLTNVDPKICFKSFKGVSAARLIDISPVQPVLSFNKNDRRFIQGKDIQMNSGTNLASMDWEDFEHLVRELFEMEFARNGGEVHVTQASRDGGVDAIVFDPDPLRGGKIVIQAKRYTNTVGVSAVRDLYGTVINEGANTGILITTSDYGHDSYEFAKDKPLKLLNGGHLLALLHKNGKEGYINIKEAKDSRKEE